MWLAGTVSIEGSASGGVRRGGLLAALAASVRSESAAAQAEAGPATAGSLAAAAASASVWTGSALAVFPEGVRTNNTAVLPFVPAVDAQFESLGRVHLVSVKYEFARFSPSHPVGPLLPHLVGLCSQLYSTMTVALVSHELRTAGRKAAEEAVKDAKTGGPGGRAKDTAPAAAPVKAAQELMAAAMGVKPVAVVAASKGSFLEYWAEAGRGSARKGRKAR